MLTLQAFRRAAAFDRSTYSTVTPYLAGDDDNALNNVWHQWVRQESLKRYVSLSSQWTLMLK
jgi:hypothetical protein